MTDVQLWLCRNASTLCAKNWISIVAHTNIMLYTRKPVLVINDEEFF